MIENFSVEGLSLPSTGKTTLVENTAITLCDM